jgi:hypothetical protein
MVLPTDFDEDKLAEIALALLSLTAHADSGVTRAWKGLDWDVLGRLYQLGWIEDPIGKQKSVVFTKKGEELASRFFEKHFGK